MKHYAGLDVSLKEISICVVDADGKTVAEACRQPTLKAWRDGSARDRCRRS